MKGKLIGYWAATAFVSLIMVISGGLAVSHSSAFAHGLAHLGYPQYFGGLLGVGKLLGAAVLLAPGLGRWKEWAYAAFGVVLVSAAYSHFNAGDGVLRAAEPLLIAGTTLVLSYRLRPADRRLEGDDAARQARRETAGFTLGEGVS